MDVVDRQVSSLVAPWAGSPEQVLAAGDLLVREGDVDDTVFRVSAGSLEILRGPELTPVDTVGPGTTIGEVAALAGCPRTATVRAVDRVVVRALGGAEYRRWLADHEVLLATLTDEARTRIDRHRTMEIVAQLLGVDPTVAAEVVASSEPIQVAAGAVLFAEGDPSDAGYLLVSGRLTVSRAGAHLGEVGRGEIVGEIGLIERAPRSATVVASRDSTLARFSADAFRALTASHPALMLQLSRTILARIHRQGMRADRARSISVTVTASGDTRTLVARIAHEVGRHGSVTHLWAAHVDAELGRPGLVEEDHSLTRPALAEYLHEVETTNDYLLVETDATDTRWTRVALAMADRIVVVVSADPDPDELRRVAAVLAAVPERARIERWLVLLHDADALRPHGGAELADRFGFDRVANVRAGSVADINRIARLVSGNGTGLVLGGGGARGFAHLGVWRALAELDVEIDTIAGASIGAPLGAAMALQMAPDELVARVAQLFHGLLDYTVPVVSLVKGERITRNIATMFPAVDLRDLWLPFMCVSTNLTRSRVEVHDRGDAATAIRASVAIPGILPPVPLGGDLLVDGGVLNNLPCDVMRAAGTVDRLIAVDLSPAVGPRAQEDFGLSVSGWTALRAQFGKGRSEFPGLMSVLMRALVVGSVRDRDQALTDGTVDCYLDLELRGVQLLDFERVREIADRGYEAARPRLEAWLAGENP